MCRVLVQLLARFHVGTSSLHIVVDMHISIIMSWKLWSEKISGMLAITCNYNSYDLYHEDPRQHEIIQWNERSFTEWQTWKLIQLLGTSKMNIKLANIRLCTLPGESSNAVKKMPFEQNKCKTSTRAWSFVITLISALLLYQTGSYRMSIVGTWTCMYNYGSWM